MCSFQLGWLFWLLAAIVPLTQANEVVEVDLVFPRNGTYSPADKFPIVFAVQNTQKVELLNLDIWYYIRHGDDGYWGNPWNIDLKWVNWSSSADPYLAYFYTSELNTTGDYSVHWEVDWQSCDVKTLAIQQEHGGRNGGVLSHDYLWGQYFTIDNSPPQEVDLVAGTANATCPKDQNAVSINVTNTVMDSPKEPNTANRDTCVVTANSTHKTDPCRVSINANAAASIAAEQKRRLCNSLSPPDDCPDENAESGAQQLAIIGLSCLLVALGGVGFILL